METRMLNYYMDEETYDIAHMHKKFGMTYNLKPKALNHETLMSRAEFIQEEVDELMRAIEQNNYLEVIDALVDIVVVVKGTAVMMGLKWKLHWKEVLRANLAKERGSNPKRPDLKEDLIKPLGWHGPSHSFVLNSYDR
jgi:predicted HAD superfamily Cof-like phosphohydrolase